VALDESQRPDRDLVVAPFREHTGERLVPKVEQRLEVVVAADAALIDLTMHGRIVQPPALLWVRTET